MTIVRTLLPIVSMIGLALVFVPAVVFLSGSIGKGIMTTIMLIGTIVWFVSVPFWMGRKPDGD